MRVNATSRISPSVQVLRLKLRFKSAASRAPEVPPPFQSVLFISKSQSSLPFANYPSLADGFLTLVCSAKIPYQFFILRRVKKIKSLTFKQEHVPTRITLPAGLLHFLVDSQAEHEKGNFYAVCLSIAASSNVGADEQLQPARDMILCVFIEEHRNMSHEGYERRSVMLLSARMSKWSCWGMDSGLVLYYLALFTQRLYNHSSISAISRKIATCTRETRRTFGVPTSGETAVLLQSVPPATSLASSRVR